MPTGSGKRRTVPHTSSLPMPVREPSESSLRLGSMPNDSRLMRSVARRSSIGRLRVAVARCSVTWRGSATTSPQPSRRCGTSRPRTARTSPLTCVGRSRHWSPAEWSRSICRTWYLTSSRPKTIQTGPLPANRVESISLSGKTLPATAQAVRPATPRASMHFWGINAELVATGSTPQGPLRRALWRYATSGERRDIARPPQGGEASGGVLPSV